MKARNFVVGIATAGWLAISAVTSPAPAALVNGTFSFTGADSYDLNANTILFQPGSSINVATGGFAPLITQGIVFDQNPVDYTNLTGLFFHSANNLMSFSFTGFAIPAENSPLAGDLSFSGTGIVTFDGFDPTPAAFGLTTQFGGDGGLVSYSASIRAVPGPLLGAGLPGLLAAAGGLLALARARRRRAQLA